MPVIALQRWYSVCAASGCRADTPTFYRLLRSWRSWGRRYHTVAHLEACLKEFDVARDLAVHPEEVELALWFHDGVYRTWRSDNEARSAEWAARFLSHGGAEPASILRVKDAILATRHAEAELTGDAALVVDIDLSILGQAPSVYDGFERQIRQEYWWVPREKYGAARSGILEGFLKRYAIYHFPMFRERYEAQARENLARAIKALQGTVT